MKCFIFSHINNSLVNILIVFQTGLKMSEQHWKECHLVSEKIVVMMVTILPIIMIPITVLITRSFIKMDRSLSVNKNSMFKTTIAFFISTILEYIALSIKLIYECYGTNDSMDSINALSIGTFYALHFLLLVLLLFRRLYLVFLNSHYGINYAFYS